MHKNQIGLPLLIVSAVVITGCSSLAADKSASDASIAGAGDLEASKRRINELESALAQKDAELASSRARLDQQSQNTSASRVDSSLFPPNPKAGECYARVLIPARVESASERVKVRDASERIEIIPARYETVQESVLIKEATSRLEVVPAVYEDVQERVLVKPASKKIVEIPAVYETITEQVVDKPAHTAWKKGPASSQGNNVLSEATSDTGEIMCLVEVPATYKTVQRRVLVTPARTEERVIPAEYKTVTKSVVKTPATTREITIPAKYDTVAVTKLVSPAQEKRIEIPAEYETVTTRKRVSDESMEWRRVMCEVNMTRENVVALQSALAEKGYYKTTVDGVIGPQTLSAAQRYARDNNLPAGSNYVPMEVVESLKISL